MTIASPTDDTEHLFAAIDYEKSGYLQISLYHKAKDIRDQYIPAIYSYRGKNINDISPIAINFNF